MAIHSRQSSEQHSHYQWMQPITLDQSWFTVYSRLCNLWMGSLDNRLCSLGHKPSSIPLDLSKCNPLWLHVRHWQSGAGKKRYTINPLLISPQLPCLINNFERSSNNVFTSIRSESFQFESWMVCRGVPISHFIVFSSIINVPAQWFSLCWNSFYVVRSLLMTDQWSLWLGNKW